MEQINKMLEKSPLPPFIKGGMNWRRKNLIGTNRWKRLNNFICSREMILEHLFYALEIAFETGLWLLYVLAVTISVMVVIWENRDPIKTLGWITAMVFVPFFGMVLFYFFGWNHRGKEKVPALYSRKMQKIWKQYPEKESLKKIHSKYQPFSTLLKQHHNAQILAGSKVEIITSGEQKFDMLMKDIEEAKHSVHMEYFTYRNDKIGTKIKELLMKKAKEGIEVRFLYDNAANWDIRSSFYREMEKAGVKVSPFFKGIFKGFKSNINYRNHRKVVVIDGKIGYMGGMNVADRYYKNPERRDTHLRMEGEGVYGLQASFLLDWVDSGEKDVKEYAQYFPPCELFSENLLQIVPRGNYSEQNTVLQATTNILNNATEYCYIQSPYFLPNAEIVHALTVAGLRGVDVRLMLPKKSDTVYVDPASHSYYEDALKA